MNNANELIFKKLDYRHYTSSDNAQSEYTIFVDNYKNALGFDEVSGGFLALQKRHQPHALFYELPLALILKREGHAVILLDESGKGKQIDVSIDGILFDMKDMSHTINYFERLIKNLRDTLKKDCLNAAISIAGNVSLEKIQDILHRLAHQPQTKYIDNIWFTLEDKLYRHKLSDFE
jgi:hypothetical protein